MSEYAQILTTTVDFCINIYNKFISPLQTGYKVFIIGILITALFIGGYKYNGIVIKFIKQLFSGIIRWWKPNVYSSIEEAYISTNNECYIPTPISILDNRNTSLLDKDSFVEGFDTPGYILNNILLNKEINNKFFLLLAHSGAGKTSLLFQLYLHYRKHSKHPLFRICNKYIYLGVSNAGDDIWEKIKLANVEHANKINGRKYKKHLLPENIILLIDSFDEDPRAWGNSEKRLNEIMHNTVHFNKILIVSRKQFYDKISQIPQFGTHVDLKPIDASIYKIELHNFYIENNIELTHKILLNYINIRGIHERKQKNNNWDEHLIQTFIEDTIHMADKASANEQLRIYCNPIITSNLNELANNRKILTCYYDIYDVIVQAWEKREEGPQKLNREIKLIDFTEKVAEIIIDKSIANTAEEINEYITTEELKSIGENRDMVRKWGKNQRSLLRLDDNGLHFLHRGLYEFFIAKLIIDGKRHDLEEKIDFNNYEVTAQILLGKRWNNQWSLNLNYPLSPSHAVLLLDYLSKNKTFHQSINFDLASNLSIQNIFFDPDWYDHAVIFDDIALFPYIKYFTQLKQVKLHSGNISDISALSELKQLTHLDLWNNQISDISALSELKQLRDLSLMLNQVSNITVLSELKQLTYLCLNHNQISDISSLSELNQLMHLYLNNNHISDISSLSELNNLTYLSIATNQIYDISTLSYLKRLTDLHLDNNQIFDITTLSELKQLTVLGLSSNKISDISVLSELKQLRDLCLINNKVTDLSAISELNHLEILNLNSNNISDISLLFNLKQMSNLSLQSNHISNVSALHELKKLANLDLSGNQICDVSALHELRQLANLNLNSNQLCDISTLSELKQLTYLGLSHNNISDISALSELKQLTNLDLQHNHISEISLLSELKNLNTLWLWGNKIYDISALSKLTQLRDLDLSYNQISDNSVLSELNQLTKLGLAGNKISDISLLSELKQLTNLFLYNNQISDISKLSELKQMSQLDLGYCQISDISVLSEFKQLTGLYLVGNKISDISALSELEQLRYLDLQNNQISDISALTDLPNLQQLKLKGNCISNLSLLSNLPIYDEIIKEMI